MSRMNFNDHYGIVYEMPGVRYQQNGRYFRGDGSPVDDDPQERTEAPDQAKGKVTNNGMTEDDLRRPENKALKTQLDVYGQEWTTRKAALEFLAKGRE